MEWREGKFSFDLTMNDNVDVGVAKGKNDKVSSSSGAANTVVGVANAASMDNDAAAIQQSLLFPNSLMTFGAAPVVSSWALLGIRTVGLDRRSWDSRTLLHFP